MPDNLDVERDDPEAHERKKDHIELALRSQIARAQMDERFDYEPLLASHPQAESAYPDAAGGLRPVEFLGKTLKAPMWISSMTGGTAEAGGINHSLARACGEFGIGMGLGSCRSLLESDEYFADFDVRADMGDEAVLMANLGIAQVELMLERGDTDRIAELLARLRADGLIVHVNPLQEWLQPEGDRLKKPAIESVAALLEKADYPIVVKEVGQGMGPKSLEALFRLPLAAVDFAAHGGTNFSKIELLRGEETRLEAYKSLAFVGHSAEHMVLKTNAILEELGEEAACRFVIASGGVKNFLDGYHLIETLDCPALYGQGAAFLWKARESYDSLTNYIKSQTEGLGIAYAFLRAKAR
jgi:isopentenyl-diphosphate delta-isomerase